MDLKMFLVFVGIGFIVLAYLTFLRVRNSRRLRKRVMGDQSSSDSILPLATHLTAEFFKVKELSRVGGNGSVLWYRVVQQFLPGSESGDFAFLIVGPGLPPEGLVFLWRSSAGGRQLCIALQAAYDAGAKAQANARKDPVELLLQIAGNLSWYAATRLKMGQPELSQGIDFAVNKILEEVYQIDPKLRPAADEVVVNFGDTPVEASRAAEVG